MTLCANCRNEAAGCRTHRLGDHLEPYEQCDRCEMVYVGDPVYGGQHVSKGKRRLPDYEKEPPLDGHTDSCAPDATDQLWAGLAIVAVYAALAIGVTVGAAVCTLL